MDAEPDGRDERHIVNLTDPKGILIAQDGFNYQGDSLAAQNFKLVRWERIVELVK
ncbi:MAG: phytase [Saprospiraceae bacterium]|nr:phytase [Lewinella sp.]